MIKEIKYNGFSASPGDHDSIEGDLAVAMNLIPEGGSIKPVLPPNEVFGLPGGYDVMCIHKTAAYTHYIIWNESTHALSYMEKDGDTYTTTAVALNVTLSGVIKAEPIGNVLAILASDGLHYILWKNGYNYLGNHFPEVNVNFRLGTISTSRYNNAETQIVDIGNKNYNDACDDDALAAQIRQAIMAVANQQMACNCQAGFFTFPFFVRYAYRLYDGESLTMHSAPIYMIPNQDATMVGIHKNGGKLEIHTTGNGWIPKVLFYDVSAAEKAELLRWRDIITSVDVFISPQFYPYDQAAKDKDIRIRTTFDNNDNADISLPPNKRQHDQVTSNASFHLVASIPLDKINTVPLDPSLIIRSDEYGKFSFDFETSNENIITREAMTDDYYTHDKIIPSSSFAYNGRLNLSGITKELFSGFWPGLFFHIYGTTQSYYCRCTVAIEQDGKEITVCSPAGYLELGSDGKFVWFFYPNPNAKELYVEHADNLTDLENGATETFFVKLKQHPFLNGAYFYGLAEDSEVVDGSDPTKEAVLAPPSPSVDRTVPQPNKVYTSEVNNPFYFPLLGINSIGSGNIMGICSAVRPVSTGQMGYADLYIFADSGVWVAKIIDKGTYSQVTLATGDVCINPDSITQLETSVLFTTSRGIMLISGSQAQCISEAIDDKNHLVPIVDTEGNSIPGTIVELMDMDMEPIASFEYFLAGCRMIYDYRGQRIIVYNRDYSYAYIYSLESHKWGMMQSGIMYAINSYPDALAVVSDGTASTLVDFGTVGEGTAAQLLITRPLTLDQPDVLKTVNTVLQRGLFHKHQGHVKSILYGSRDLYNWHLVASSNDENIQGFRGSPYKWYRIAMMLNLGPEESITGCSVVFDQRLVNRLR